PGITAEKAFLFVRIHGGIRKHLIGHPADTQFWPAQGELCGTRHGCFSSRDGIYKRRSMADVTHYGFCLILSMRSGIVIGSQIRAWSTWPRSWDRPHGLHEP